MCYGTATADTSVDAVINAMINTMTGEYMKSYAVVAASTKLYVSFTVADTSNHYMLPGKSNWYVGDCVP